ncbi:hypothetical protein [uncultured Aquimarina sp.]|uniref:hypothetical protein n=1 Tax=uncultured Aquimarina sp. TaxID=575652 RepID=UPI00262D4CA5|nr:hypothetical protein [uncultured Aquimarina sp.]
MSKELIHHPVDRKSLGNQISGTKSFGPLTITYDLDLSIPQLTANATLHGYSIGHVVINPEHPSATLGGSVGIAEAEAEVTITANFDKKELDYTVDVEAFGTTFYKGSGKLFSW